MPVYHLHYRYIILLPGALLLLGVIADSKPEFFSTPLANQYGFFDRDVTTFHCAINVTGYSLDIVAFKEDGAVQAVHTTGDASSAITGTFTITQDTRVLCRATAADLSSQVSSAFAYGQDVPEVINLKATQLQTDPCSIMLNWSIPALLPGLSVSYTVSVYLVDTVSVHNVSTTTFTYHPTTGSGVYTIQVRAFNGTLTSDTTNTTVEYADSHVDVTHIDTQVSDSGELWSYRFQLLGLCSTVPANIAVISCTVDSICFTASTYHGNVTIDDSGVVTADMDLPDDVMYNTSILVEYDSGLVLTSNEVITNTTTLRNATLLNTTNDGFCVEYKRVKKNSISASIECSTFNISSLQPATNEPDHSILNVRSCYRDIEPNVWTLYGCGGDVVCTNENAAVMIEDINVTNVTATVTSSSVFVLATTSTISPSPDVSPSISYDTALITVAILVPLVAVMLTVITAIIICICTVKHTRAKKIGNYDDTSSYQIHNPSNGINEVDGPSPTCNGNYEVVAPSKQTQQQQKSPLHYAEFAELQKQPIVNRAQLFYVDEAVQYAHIGGTSYDKCPDTIKSKTIDHSPTQTELITVLVPRVSAKWRAIGLGLGLSPQQLEEVQDNRPDDRDGCLKDVLMMWEDSATDDKPYTWATMLDVMRSGKVGEKGLADYLLQSFTL